MSKFVTFETVNSTLNDRWRCDLLLGTGTSYLVTNAIHCAVPLINFLWPNKTQDHKRNWLWWWHRWQNLIGIDEAPQTYIHIADMFNTVILTPIWTRFHGEPRPMTDATLNSQRNLWLLITAETSKRYIKLRCTSGYEGTLITIQTHYFVWRLGISLLNYPAGKWAICMFIYFSHNNPWINDKTLCEHYWQNHFINY